jgi:protein-tyrosine phosphatase
MHRVLFVCLGNICRSPLAEAAFRAEADKAGIMFEADSAGTGDWHLGKAPDPRSQAVALANGVDISGLRARQVSVADFHGFTHVIAMDHTNMADLKRLMPGDATATLALLLDYVPGREGQEVADPYFGGAEGFAVTWTDVTEAARHLVRRLL